MTDTTPEEDLGRVIQIRRAQLGLKRKELAALATVSYVHLSAVELGKTGASAQLLARLATALQTTTADLLTPVAASSITGPAGPALTRTELDTWGRDELPALIRKELARLFAP